MPRGGRRPGAGARKGNTNALKSMNHSPRARMVYELLLIHPDKRLLGQILIDNGLSLPRKFTPRDRRRAIEIYYNHFFDRSDPKQSTTIKHKQPPAPATAEHPGAIKSSTPSPDSIPSSTPANLHATPRPQQ
jgi:hypothetical protein